MSPKEKRDVNPKLKILNHAEQHGNIRKTCRYYGVSNTIFYDWVNNQEYTQFDRDLIRLLYHPEMKAELPPLRAERLIEMIFLEENQSNKKKPQLGRRYFLKNHENVFC